MKLMEANLLHDFIIESSIYLKVRRESFEKSTFIYFVHKIFRQTNIS